MPQTLTLEGQTFELVKTQRIGASVYRGADSYLRIGPPAAIDKLVALHRRMEAANFPVAKILGEGEHDKKKYYIEESLGDKRFAELFADDMTTAGAITPENFSAFLSIVERFARAQMQTVVATDDHHSLRDGIHLEILCAELPQQADRIRKRFEQARTSLASYPYVLTHGDFNPANIYPMGVIDLEDSFYAPLGFDIISALITIDWFPNGDDYEFYAKYRFTDAQCAAYLSRVDDVFRENGYPALASRTKDLDFMRGLWLAARMHEWPRIQKYRYERLIRTHLA